jgi:hypothetical protein
MSDTDQLTESAELRELSSALRGVALPERPPLGTITARGRARQHRRRFGVACVSMAGTAAVTALALSLTGVLGQARPPMPGVIKTAAFTLVSNPDGTATLTINPAELFDAATLQADLAQDGIPAKVTVGSFCSSDPAPAGFSQVWNLKPSGEVTILANSGTQPSITLNPAAMPPGAELSFGDFQLGSGQQLATAVLIDSSSYTCSISPPPPPADGAQFLYGGHTKG